MPCAVLSAVRRRGRRPSPARPQSVGSEAHASIDGGTGSRLWISGFVHRGCSADARPLIPQQLIRRGLRPRLRIHALDDHGAIKPRPAVGARQGPGTTTAYGGNLAAEHLAGGAVDDLGGGARYTPIDSTAPWRTITPSATSERAPTKQSSSMMVGLACRGSSTPPMPRRRTGARSCRSGRRSRRLTRCRPWSPRRHRRRY